MCYIYLFTINLHSMHERQGYEPTIGELIPKKPQETADQHVNRMLDEVANQVSLGQELMTKAEKEKLQRESTSGTQTKTDTKLN